MQVLLQVGDKCDNWELLKGRRNNPLFMKHQTIADIVKSWESIIEYFVNEPVSEGMRKNVGYFLHCTLQDPGVGMLASSKCSYS